MFRYDCPLFSDAAVTLATAQESVEFLHNLLDGQTQTPLEAAFPNVRNTPAITSQMFADTSVTRDVARNLLTPELRARAWPFEQVAVMAMPEAAIHEDDCLAGPEDKVWFAGEVLAMKPVPPAHCMQAAAHDQLRPSVGRSDAGHHPASDFRAHDIRQPCTCARAWSAKHHRAPACA